MENTQCSTWQHKAHRMISEMCMTEWRRANVKADGSMRKRHVPYAVPDDAKMLMECLRTNDEITAKEYFVRRAVMGDTYREVA